MNNNQLVQEETKIQPDDQAKTEKREIIQGRPLHGFAALTKKKLHILSQRKVDR